MNLCNSSVYKSVVFDYFEELNVLSPIKRACEIFKLETDHLSFTLKATDEIFGWFLFDGEAPARARCFSDGIPSDELKQIMGAPELHGSQTKVDKGHTLVDYEFILKNGLIAYQQRIAKELMTSPSDEYLLAMSETLETVKKLIARMEAAAERNVNGCKNANEIKNALRQVPFYPARTFREAIQSIWIIHFLLPLSENAWYSISLGKFDKYVYPYYKKSISDGMTTEEAKRILYNFYELLNSYADGACLLNVGGEEYNEFSKLIIECQRDFGMPGPILGARITSETDDETFDMMIDERLFVNGQPTFYGEDACVHALVEKGIPPEKAKQFSNNSCMGISLAGEEFNSMWGCVFSISALLEAAVNEGKMLHKTVVVPDIPAVANLEELYNAFEKCAAYLFDICVASYEAKASYSERVDPNPFVSLLTDGCIEKHCDRISGAKYHNVTVECMGMVNASDGICAIDTLVFKEKKYTLQQLSAAVNGSFDGSESIRADLLRCAKYGQNAGAEDYAVKVAEILQKVIRNRNHDSIYYCPSLHTLDCNIQHGSGWGAGYDGRRAGDPFAKNGGASNCARKADPTSLILSAAKLPQYKFFGGQPIDVSFDAELVKNHKETVAALIRTYLNNGGIQFQVNALSSKLLRCAMEKPEQYPNLIVRVGGYSLYFSRLSQKSKEEFIERFEKEGN